MISKEKGREYLKTPWPELNHLLGGGIYPGTFTLISGLAGTGKTTIALLTSANFAEDEQNKRIDTAIYFAVEESEDSLRRLLKIFGKSNNLAEENFRVVELNSPIKIGESTKTTTSGDADSRLINWCNFWLDKGFELSPIEIDLEQNSILTGDEDGDVDFESDEDKYVKLQQLIKEKKIGQNILLVIDSISALASITYADAKDRYHNRQIYNYVKSSIKELSKRLELTITVIMVSEQPSAKDSHSIESYLADTVINLSVESKKRIIYNSNVSGVNESQPLEWEEILHFCAVTKARGSQNQRRKVCYDFIEGIGIKFYPTYSAQGVVSLFQENAAQLDIIRTLREVDSPGLFPGLIVQEFTRNALQKNEAVRRKADSIPNRHPLHLFHVDEYWIPRLVKQEKVLLQELEVDSLHLYSGNDQSNETDSNENVIPELKKHRTKGFLVNGFDDKKMYAVPHMGNVGIFVIQKLLLRPIRHDLYRKFECKYRQDKESIEAPDDWDFIPESWEQVVYACKKLREFKLPSKLLFETTTFDSMITTMLELGWANGAFWKTVIDSRSLRVGPEDENSTQINWFVRFVWALEQLHLWIHKYKIVPLNSTVEAEKNRDDDWVFARHWYSTWVDTLHTKLRNNDGASSINEIESDFTICQIPLFEGFRIEASDTDQKVGAGCWGEWYLAMQSGSENTQLGYAIIKNLLSAQKIVDGAMDGALIPLQEQFYEEYGKAKMFGTGGKTYDEFRVEFLESAKTRTVFDDFRKVARKLSGKLRAILLNNNLKRTVTEQLNKKPFKQYSNNFAKIADQIRYKDIKSDDRDAIVNLVYDSIKKLDKQFDLEVKK